MTKNQDPNLIKSPWKYHDNHDHLCICYLPLQFHHNLCFWYISGCMWENLGDKIWYQERFQYNAKDTVVVHCHHHKKIIWGKCKKQQPSCCVFLYWSALLFNYDINQYDVIPKKAHHCVKHDSGNPQVIYHIIPWKIIQKKRNTDV